MADAPARPELVATVRDYMAAARSPGTREAYGQACANFEAWCAREGRQPLPASPETIALWMGALAKGDTGRRPSPAPASIRPCAPSCSRTTRPGTL